MTRCGVLGGKSDNGEDYTANRFFPWLVRWLTEFTKTTLTVGQNGKIDNMTVPVRLHHPSSNLLSFLSQIIYSIQKRKFDCFVVSPPPKKPPVKTCSNLIDYTFKRNIHVFNHAFFCCCSCLFYLINFFLRKVGDSQGSR